MCHDFDRFYEKARVAELMRRKQETAEELKQRGNAGVPVKPAKAEERGNEELPVPA